jgi:hypothetical protein
MYLIITEFGEFRSAKSISEHDKLAANEGVLDIIDVSNPEKPAAWDSDKFVPLKSWHDCFDPPTMD